MCFVYVVVLVNWKFLFELKVLLYEGIVLEEYIFFQRNKKCFYILVIVILNSVFVQEGKVNKKIRLVFRCNGFYI